MNTMYGNTCTLISKFSNYKFQNFQISKNDFFVEAGVGVRSPKNARSPKIPGVGVGVLKLFSDSAALVLDNISQKLNEKVKNRKVVNDDKVK